MGGAGRAFVFSSTSGGWGQTAELAGRDTQAGDNFGFSVAEGSRPSPCRRSVAPRRRGLRVQRLR